MAYVNNDRIKVLTNIYLLRLDELLAGDEDPRARWRAAKACVQGWDPEAEDFGGMFRKTIAGAKRFLQPASDEEVSRPVDGILALCDAGRGEEVREAFADLTEDADAASLQDQAQTFVKRINEMLDESLHGEWQYRQNLRDGIGYLAFIRPAENYLYRAPETALFAGYTEAEEEIGYERSFSLAAYYRFCTEISLYLMSRKDVQEAVTRVLASVDASDGSTAEAGSDPAAEADPAELDPELHLLTADLIHAAYVGKFYDDKAANRKSRVSTASQRRIERARQQAKLLEQREFVAGRLYEAALRENGAGMPDLQGRQVRHKAFGEGTITVHDGKYLTVVFPKGTKKFALPGVVVGGYLSFEDADKVVEACGAMDKIVTERRRIGDELSAIDVQLRMLE